MFRIVYAVVRADEKGRPHPTGGTSAGNLAGIEFSFIPGDERNLEVKAFESRWRELVGPVPEARSIIFASDLISVGAPVNVKISDSDEQNLELASEKLMNELSKFSGIFDIESDQDQGLNEIQLRLKPEARSLGVSLQDVALQVRAAFFGDEALRVQRGQEDVRVYIRLPEEERNSIVVNIPRNSDSSSSAVINSA